MSANESIADIVAEMRERDDLRGGDMVDNFHIEAEYGEYGGWDGLELIKAYADRLEAAWKREHGNAAAMRDALEFLRDKELYLLEGNVRHCIGLTVFGLEQTCKIMRGVIEEALSKPPRNCDVMDWRTAWAKWRTENHPQNPVGYRECYESTTMFMDWYTGTAERKGEEDGSK